jgi:hypothetical protein
MRDTIDSGADLDRNGTIEILAVKTSKGPLPLYGISVAMFSPDGRRLRCEKLHDYGGYNPNIGAADLDGDSIPEWSVRRHLPYGISIPNGTPFRRSDVQRILASSVLFSQNGPCKTGMGADNNDRDEFTDSPPSFGDIDGDGLPELIIYSDHEKPANM